MAREAPAQPDRSASPQRSESRPQPISPPPLAQRPQPRPAERFIELDMIEVTRAEYRASDIAALAPAEGVAAAAGPALARADDTPVVGSGPNGETLYAAEWAREPTDAELAGYLPPGAPEGWGLVACKTVPGNRVEDCIELGNHPRGSRLASAVRQAAWQFRVRPPRRNGRPLVGEWVRIRIDYSRSPPEG